jgi:D-glutamate cyclase
MDASDRAIAEIERLSGQDVQRRNIGPLAAYARGNLARAAASIARHPSPSIAIITGFYLGHGDPPNCETDGPPGAAMLAAGFAAAGIPCRIATDVVNARVVLATAAAADPQVRVPIDIVSMRPDGEDGAAPLAQVKETWRRLRPSITHVVSIERCGPSRDGCPRDARGVDMTNCNAPLEILFNAGPWTTIGIGDLGNEIGMGSLPHELVARNVPRGDQIWCRVACDYPIVGGVSNWAGAALLGAVALLWPRGAGAMLECLRPELGRQLLEAAVWDGGAVASDRSGAIPRNHMFVDCQPWTVLEQIHRQIYDLCRGAVLATEAQAPAT